MVTKENTYKESFGKTRELTSPIEDREKMHLLDLIDELKESFLPTVAKAESDDDDEEEEDEDEDDDDDDEDEEEAADPLDTLRAECSKNEVCTPFVHHYSECIERVTKEQEEPDYAEKHYKEDCVEEFLHLQHHVNDCVAPRLFYKLK